MTIRDLPPSDRPRERLQKLGVEALSAHESQFLNPEKERDYIEGITAMARSFGLQARCKYGQGFYAVEPISVTDIMSLAECWEGEPLLKNDIPHGE